MPKQLAIVLVNWNSFDLTRDTIHSLQKTSFQNYDCIVVDNGSADDSAQQLEKIFPEIILLRSEINKGFTGGNNLGMHYALYKGYELIMMLNNDVEVLSQRSGDQNTYISSIRAKLDVDSNDGEEVEK